MRPYPRADRARHQIRRAVPRRPAATQDLGITVAQATANLRAWAETQRWKPRLDADPGGGLRAASTSLMVERLNADLKSSLSRSWRGRLVLAISRWRSAR